MKEYMKYLIIIATLLLSTACQSSICKIEDIKSHFTAYDEVTLSEPLTIEYIENKQRVSFLDKAGQEKKLPFGRINDKWKELKNIYKQDDCLMHFRTGDESWKTLSGREGYLLARDGEILYIILTKVS